MCKNNNLEHFITKTFVADVGQTLFDCRFCCRMKTDLFCFVVMFEGDYFKEVKKSKPDLNELSL